jgi:hypothetical protein
MPFQISGLPLEPFSSLFALGADELRRRDIIRVTADRCPGFPCRVSLRDAEPGETLLLLNFEHQPARSPYRSRHAIYVRENAAQAQLQAGEIPDVLATRLISIRAFDRTGMMSEADVVDGRDLAAAIERMFTLPSVDYLHLHNAKPGCFAARADRVP